MLHRGAAICGAAVAAIKIAKDILYVSIRKRNREDDNDEWDDDIAEEF